MRIGLISDTFLPVVDGVGRVVVAYAETLSGMGHQVTVSAPAYDTGHRGGYPFELVDYNGVRVPTYPQYRTGNPAMDRHYKRRIDMIPLDIVHAHSPFAAGTESLRLSRQRGIPLVCTFHSKYYDDFLKATRSESIAKAVLSNIVSFYKKCDEVWTLSESSNQVLREYGYKGPARVMTNGTALRMTSDEAIRAVEEKYRLGDYPVLLYAGQMNWKKNILRILEAAKIVQDYSPYFKLVLAGFGQDEAAIRQKIQEFGLEEQAIMTGMITDTASLDALYARARLFLFPSLYDTFSMVIREAAAMGTPSVAVAGSCAAESIRDGGNGFLCLDEAWSLADVIKRALAFPDEMKRVGEAARTEIPVPWEKVMKDVVGQYEILIQNHLGIHSSQRRYQRKHPD